MNSSIIKSCILSVVLFYGCQHQPELPSPSGNPNPGGGNAGNTQCDPDSVYFNRDILPLLRSNCAMSGCHDGSTRSDGVWLESYASVMNSDIIEQGDAFDSDLYEVLVESDPGDRMPQGGPPLSQTQIDMVRKWIDQGAPNNNCQSCDTSNFTYSGQVAPLLQKNCLGCHSGTGASANVHLDSYVGVKTVADNGRLVGAVSHATGFKPMPQGGKLQDCEIITIQKWVAAGAPNN